MWERKCGTLQNGSNDHDEGPEKDHPPPAHQIANEYRDHGTNETAQVVACNCDALNGSSMVITMREDVNFRKGFDEAREGQETRHHTLARGPEVSNCYAPRAKCRYCS
jgi:hypothetical protein